MCQVARQLGATHRRLVYFLFVFSMFSLVMFWFGDQRPPTFAGRWMLEVRLPWFVFVDFVLVVVRATVRDQLVVTARCWQSVFESFAARHGSGHPATTATVRTAWFPSVLMFWCCPACWACPSVCCLHCFVLLLLVGLHCTGDRKLPPVASDVES